MLSRVRSRFALAVLLVCLLLATAAGSLAQEATPAAGTASCPALSAADATAVGTAFMEAINAHDGEALAALLGPDYVHHWAFGDDTVGAEAYVAGFAALTAAFPDLTLATTDIIASDDLVVIAWAATGTQEEPFLGFPPSDVSATWSGLFVHRLECGQIADTWTEADHLSRLQQQGAISAPGATPEP